MNNVTAVIGIDPGLTGAIAIMQGNEIELHDIPVSAKTVGKGQQLNLAALHDLLRGIDAEIWLEQVGTRTGEGPAGAFTFGRIVGQMEGIIAALSLPIFYVTPQKWKKPLGLIGHDKDAARTLAIQRFPFLAKQLSLKKHGGRADALWIAHHGYRQHV